ncbi:MAG: SDR family oxidoreductase [Candidatus Heimdallarchaeota archaeon]
MNSSNDLSNKTIVITGGTSGVGKETARELAKRNATLVIIARNMELAKQVKEEFVKETNNNKIEFIHGDLASLQSVKTAAEEIRKKYSKIDVLINNAGLFSNKRTLSEDGYEITFAVDHLAHYFLVLLLIDKIKKADHARIINVSSNIHLFFGLKIKDLQQEKFYTSFRAYAHAKSANVLHAYELHNRLADSGITVNAFHPGKVLTKINEDLPKIAIKLGKFDTPEDSAKALVHLAVSEELANESGKYFQKFEMRKSSRQSYKTELQKQLWDESLKLIQTVFKDFKPTL